MNGMYRQIKSVGALLQITRGYAIHKKIPVEWVRPEPIPCTHPKRSGDGGIDLNVSQDDYMNKFEHSKELEDADEIVKKMFTISFNRRKERIYLQRRKARELVRRHEHDMESMECKIAVHTVDILQLQELQEQFPQNKRVKVVLKELIEKRNKYLKLVRQQDYPRFEYLLEKLNLTYIPFPEEYPPVHRKDSTKKLLNKYCDKMVQDKLNAYKQELEAQQKNFFKEKVEKLEFIRNEEIACGVPPTVTEEEIEAAKQKAATFVS